MMRNAWQRRRSPDDVPTPVAVAVSDFCRRAGAPATPGEVREALSLLTGDEDFRVRALTDSEPKARPLGPFAVIDVLRGTPEALAAKRQECGYYDLTRELAQSGAQPPPPEPAGPTAAVALGTRAGGVAGDADDSERVQESVAAPSPPDEARPSRTAKERAPTVAERIAPKRRPAAEVLPRAPVSALEPEHPRTRDERRPKGRFTQVAPQRVSVDELFDFSARDVLQSRLDQYPDRFALTRALGETYGGRKEGQPLRTEDLERALRHHGLLERVERKERDAILAAFSDERGALSRAAFALNLTVPELNKLVKSLGLTEQVEQIRERFRRDALSPKHLAARLDLLGRGKYLADLGIRRKFDDALRSDLRELMQKLVPEARDARDLLALAAKHEATQMELVARAFEKLGLMEELRKQFPDTTHSNYLA